VELRAVATGFVACPVVRCNWRANFVFLLRTMCLFCERFRHHNPHAQFEFIDNKYQLMSLSEDMNDLNVYEPFLVLVAQNADSRQRKISFVFLFLFGVLSFNIV
jgi:hypothetical protein